MSKHKNILLFSLVLIGIGIIIGLPTFLSGCNLSATKYCAFSYNKFNEYVYETEIKEDKCGRNRDSCFDKSTLTQLWYVGIIFFSLTVLGLSTRLLLCIGIRFVEHITKTFRENYSKCSTDQNKNIDIEMV